MRKTQEEIDKIRAELQWKMELYSLALETLDDAEAGDKLSLMILSRCGLIAAPKLVH